MKSDSNCIKRLYDILHAQIDGTRSLLLIFYVILNELDLIVAVFDCSICQPIAKSMTFNPTISRI